MICWTRTARRFVTNGGGPIRDLLLPTGSSIEEGPGYLDVAGHSDLCVALQRFSEPRLRLFAITWGGAIN
jgi:hypothetical protein